MCNMCCKKATSNDAHSSLCSQVAVDNKLWLRFATLYNYFELKLRRAQPRGPSVSPFSQFQSVVKYIFVFPCFFLISWPRFVKLEARWIFTVLKNHG